MEGLRFATGPLTRNENHTDIQGIIFWVAWQQMEVFTLSQFLSIYWAKWVTPISTEIPCTLVV